MKGIKITVLNTVFMFVCLVVNGDTMRCYFNHEIFGQNCHVSHQLYQN